MRLQLIGVSDFVGSRVASVMQRVGGCWGLLSWHSIADATDSELPWMILDQQRWPQSDKQGPCC
jgi:hypothetical protein